MIDQKYDYGMMGLGTMGRNLVFNMNDHGYKVVGFDKNESQVSQLNQEAGDKNVFATNSLEEFVNSLKTPRVILLLVPAGKIVDDVIDELKPLLKKEDLLMDCGNSHFTDTNIRMEQLAKSGMHFMGVGVSGGESGARYGPSIMPGGLKDVYERVSGMLQSVSAKVDKEPCVSWLGNGSAGHYVKMVHNGIEYGLMQLISEAYHLLKVVGGLNNKELFEIFTKWNKGILHSFLIEITADIFSQKDDITGKDLVDMILDRAKQKGTGGWTSEDAMNLQVPIPVIDLAVSMRNLSAYKKDRESAQQKLKGPEIKLHDKNELANEIEQALYFSMVVTYAQGMALLAVASKEYKYDLNLETIAKIWRGGCIIRASLLEDIRLVFSKQPGLSNILLSENISQKLFQSQNGIRKTVQTGIENGIPLASMMGALTYYDAFRSGWLPANLIQAQRDYFGAHTYERIDKEGVFHTHWNQEKS